MDQKWSYFILVFIKTVSEIEVIAPPPLAETFQMKRNYATQTTWESGFSAYMYATLGVSC